MLGLGRAVGETIAVTLVIGNRRRSAKSIFGQGYTLAAVIASEFGEAATTAPPAALIACGLVLFVITLVVNAIARSLVRAAAARRRAVAAGMSVLRAPSTPRRRATRPRRSRALCSSRRWCAVPLVLVIYYLLKRGLGAWSVDFFTTDPTGNFLGDPGGVKARCSARS